MNPYEILGVDRFALLKQIRAAYRKQAKIQHPDVGGDPAAFARLRLAHDILIDPDRRARFDATGDVSETTPDNSVTAAMSHLSVALGAIVSRSPQFINKLDLVQAVRQELTHNLRTLAQEKIQIQAALPIWENVAKRFKVKDRANPNYLADIANGYVAGYRDQITKNEARQQGIEKALALLKDVTYTTDMTSMFDFGGMTNTASSFVNMKSL